MVSLDTNQQHTEKEDQREKNSTENYDISPCWIDTIDLERKKTQIE